MYIGTLQTERLTIAPLCRDDVDGIFALRSNPKVIAYTGIEQYRDIAQAEAYVDGIITGMNTGTSVMWSLRLHTGEFIGGICLWNFSDDLLTAEIGYDMLPEFHGHGYMSEAAAAVIGYAFDRLGFERIVADLLPENHSSVKLLERMGFRHVQDHTRTLGKDLRRMAIYELKHGV